MIGTRTNSPLNTSDWLSNRCTALIAELLPEPGASVLDVGAGTGRDAAWFASKGHRVVAVEPSQEMRKAGQNAHKDANIQWLSDRLPALEKVVRSKLTFDLIWLSAVWMHVPPRERRRAFRKLVSVMSPGASMMVSLRQGPPDPSRPMHPVRSDEVEKLAREYGLLRVPVTRRGDARGRPDIDWQVLWLRLPDDGTNALPLLRHVVFNDNKSTHLQAGSTARTGSHRGWCQRLCSRERGWDTHRDSARAGGSLLDSRLSTTG